MSREMLPTNANDSMATRLLEILRRRKLLAASTFLMVFAAAAAFALYLPDLYRGTAIVLIERPVSESVVRMPVAGELESRLQIIKQEILSRDRLTALIDKFHLYPELRKKGGAQDLLEQARNDIAVEPLSAEQANGRIKTIAFKLTYTGDTRETASDVTNAVADFYVAQNAEMRTQEAVRTSQLLAKEVADAKRNLERHEAALRDFTTRNAGELPQQAMITLATLTQLNESLTGNNARRLRLLDQRDKLFEERGSSASAAARAAADPDASPQSLERLRLIEEEKVNLAGLEAKFSAIHPEVRTARERLAALENAHAAAEKAEAQRRAAAAAKANEVAAAAAAPVVGRRTIEEIDAELAALKQEETALKGRINDLTAKLESTPNKQQEYTLVTRDYSTAKDTYDSLVRRLEEAQLTQTVETGQAGERFRILEKAIPPEGPSAPNRPRLLVMGLLLALAAAAAAVMVREQFDTSFHTIDEVREFTAVPVLVSIPPIGPASTGRRVRMALATASAIAGTALVAAGAAYLAQGNEQLVRLIAF